MSLSAQQSIFIKFSSFDSRLLDDIVRQVVSLIKRVGGQVSGPIPLPKDIKRVTVNRSPHVNSKAKEQFELSIHKRGVAIRSASGEIVEKLSKLELPAGVDVKIEVINTEK